MLKTYFLLFIFYAFIGWCLEIGLSLVQNKKFVNRGFLMGPYCPIYGCGALLLTILLSSYADDPWVLFGLAIILFSILEYFTSWIMEVIFKMRWWDYSNEKFNINGRICLETMIPFGILGVILIKYVNPLFMSWVNILSENALNIIVVILAGIFITDLIISSNIIFNFKNLVKDSKKDSTEEIKKYIRKVISNNKIVYTRLANAFPNLQKAMKEQKEKNRRKKERNKKKTRS